jgi:hypothetical protein
MKPLRAPHEPLPNDVASDAKYVVHTKPDPGVHDALMLHEETTLVNLHAQAFVVWNIQTLILKPYRGNYNI